MPITLKKTTDAANVTAWQQTDYDANMTAIENAVNVLDSGAVIVAACSQIIPTLIPLKQAGPTFSHLGIRILTRPLAQLRGFSSCSRQQARKPCNGSCHGLRHTYATPRQRNGAIGGNLFT